MFLGVYFQFKYKLNIYQIKIIGFDFFLYFKIRNWTNSKAIILKESIYKLILNCLHLSSNEKEAL